MPPAFAAFLGLVHMRGGRRRSPSPPRRPKRWAYAGLSALAIACLGGVAPARAAAIPVPGPVERAPTTAKEVAFAINVVWGTEYVLPIARTLKTHGARATFFLGGRWAYTHPTEARALQAMGMEIASHGDRHRHVGSLSVAENLTEIDRAADAIAAATGVRPKLYAPAYGEISPAVLEAARLRHVPVVLWTIDTVDWRTWHTPDVIRARVIGRLTPGAIVLMHPTDRTLAALPGILAACQARGYRVVAVSDLFRAQSATRHPGSAPAPLPATSA